MFQPKTEKIAELLTQNPKAIKQVEAIFDKPTNIYIDAANVHGWSDKLGWQVEPKRLKQLLDSHDMVKSVKFYIGTLQGNQESERRIYELRKMGYEVITKPVKIMRLSIDVSSIPSNSPTILQNFIRKPLLAKLNVETIELLNSKLKELNDNGINYVMDRKCNFDVELGRHMLRDYDQDNIDNFILWSGDSDFADPVRQLMKDGKRVVIFSTARRVSSELNQTGAEIFEINKIRDFICRPKDAKRTPERSP